MFKLISCFILLLLNAYTNAFNLIGLAVDCGDNPSITCTVLFLPTGYFAVKNVCFNSILQKSFGLFILYQNSTFNIKYIIKDETVTYLYPNNNQLIKPIDYIWDGRYVSFYNSTNSNYILYGFIDNIEVEIKYNQSLSSTVTRQLFSHYISENRVIFNELNVFPKIKKIIDVDYKNTKICKKHNLLIYDPELYDNTCHILS